MIYVLALRNDQSHEKLKHLRCEWYRFLCSGAFNLAIKSVWKIRRRSAGTRLYLESYFRKTHDCGKVSLA